MVVESVASYSLKVILNVVIVAISSFMVYLGVDVEAFTMFSILLCIDYITGLTKARAISESITSNKMKYGIVSKLSLIIIPLVLAISGKAMSYDLSNIVFVSVNILVLSELYSIVGNIYAVRNKKELPEYDVVSIIGKKIRDTLIQTVGGK